MQLAKSYKNSNYNNNSETSYSNNKQHNNSSNSNNIKLQLVECANILAAIFSLNACKTRRIVCPTAFGGSEVFFIHMYVFPGMIIMS